MAMIRAGVSPICKNVTSNDLCQQASEDLFYALEGFLIAIEFLDVALSFHLVRS